MTAGWKEYLRMFPDFEIKVGSMLGDKSLVAVFRSTFGTYNGKRGLVLENRIEMPAAWKAIVANGKIKLWQVYTGLDQRLQNNRSKIISGARPSSAGRAVLHAEGGKPNWSHDGFVNGHAGQDDVAAVRRHADDLLALRPGSFATALAGAPGSGAGEFGRPRFSPGRTPAFGFNAGEDGGGAAGADQAHRAAAGRKAGSSAGHNLLARKSFSQARHSASAARPGGSAGCNCSSSRTVPRL